MIATIEMVLHRDPEEYEFVFGGSRVATARPVPIEYQDGRFHIRRGDHCARAIWRLFCDVNALDGDGYIYNVSAETMAEIVKRCPISVEVRAL